MSCRIVEAYRLLYMPENVVQCWESVRELFFWSGNVVQACKKPSYPLLFLLFLPLFPVPFPSPSSLLYSQSSRWSFQWKADPLFSVPFPSYFCSSFHSSQSPSLPPPFALFRPFSPHSYILQLFVMISFIFFVFWSYFHYYFCIILCELWSSTITKVVVQFRKRWKNEISSFFLFCANWLKWNKASLPYYWNEVGPNSPDQVQATAQCQGRTSFATFILSMSQEVDLLRVVYSCSPFKAY